MNFISRFFNPPKIDCPRCLGKGHVDWDDIKRLNNELKWRPGKCAYCNGKGKVSSKMISKVKADNTYLTTDITTKERRKLFKGDPDASQRANNFEDDINDFINNVEYLHFVKGKDAKQIVVFFLKPGTEPEMSQREKKELLEYIEQIIERKKSGEI